MPIARCAEIARDWPIVSVFVATTLRGAVVHYALESVLYFAARRAAGNANVSKELHRAEWNIVGIVVALAVGSVGVCVGGKVTPSNPRVRDEGLYVDFVCAACHFSAINTPLLTSPSTSCLEVIVPATRRMKTTAGLP